MTDQLVLHSFYRNSYGVCQGFCPTGSYASVEGRGKSNPFFGLSSTQYKNPLSPHLKRGGNTRSF